MNQKLPRLIIMSSVLLLGVCGCSAPSGATGEKDLTVGPILEPTASATLSFPTVEKPRPTPTAAPTLQPYLTLPPLPPLDDEFMNSDFIFEASSPDCSLPCWQDLTVGESGRNVIEN